MYQEYVVAKFHVLIMQSGPQTTISLAGIKSI